MMRSYRDIDGDSGVVAYSVSGTSITVRFHDGSEYVYDSIRPGSYHVQQMIALAERGDGQNRYINKHVGRNFSRKNT